MAPRCLRLAPILSALALATVSAAADGEAGAVPSSSLRGAAQPDQVLVFDAGSSGTRIHVFNIYSSQAAAPAQVPTIDLAVRGQQTLKVKPGLSDFAQREDTTGAQQNIQKLLDFANRFVPAERRAATPAMLKATAGLRSVSEAKADAVLDAIRETFSKSGYKFERDWAGIIKGKEEGGLAWIAANYLAGTFQRGDGPTVGVIEMGGGSTQVTFQVSSSAPLEPDDDFVFETATKKKYRLYAHSYLGFGQDHAQAKMRGLIGSGMDPCYPAGYARKSDSGATVEGGGNGRSCMATIADKLWDTSPVSPGRYAKEMRLVGSFVATENFFFTQNDEKLGWEDRLVSSALFESAAEKTCGTALPAEDAEKARAGSGDPGSPKQCFGLSYQVELLKALKAASGSVDVRIRHQINGGDIDWALGAALVHYIQGHPVAGESTGFSSWATVLLLLVLLAMATRLVTLNSCAKQTLIQVTGLKPTKIGSTKSGPLPSPVE